jgi:hypothetical protein
MFVLLAAVRRILVKGQWWDVVLGSVELANDFSLVVDKDDVSRNLRLWNTALSLIVQGEEQVKRFIPLSYIEAIEVWPSQSLQPKE